MSGVCALHFWSLIIHDICSFEVCKLSHEALVFSSNSNILLIRCPHKLICIVFFLWSILLVSTLSVDPIVLCTVLEIYLASVVCIHCYIIICSSPYSFSLYFCRIMMRYLLWNFTLLYPHGLVWLKWILHWIYTMLIQIDAGPSSHTFTDIFTL